IPNPTFPTGLTGACVTAPPSVVPDGCGRALVARAALLTCAAVLTRAHLNGKAPRLPRPERL
ncbi:hypothetical protein, partial [Deinococcus sp. 23YEL01]|uniref:hypothetical protein n=1 Tax=Deinococcus sp. 23YEL01 TaxID=2745871 RepID=UPI001E2F2EA1